MLEGATLIFLRLHRLHEALIILIAHGPDRSDGASFTVTIIILVGLINVPSYILLHSLVVTACGLTIFHLYVF